MRNADIAMYVAKGSKGDFAVYDPRYDTHQQEHLSMLGELRRAVEKGQLRVFYQPKVAIAASSAGAVEALLRWEHPTRGFVSPGEFIPFAEHTGYIKVLTRWVLNEAIRQCGEWLALGRPLRVSVNISARDLMSRELPDLVSEMLSRHGVPPELLCIEITESGFMEDPVHAQRVLDALHALGIQLSIDDYGTGYSSLSYIVRLPVDELKIDRSFVMRMSTDATTLTIVRSTIELGHNLGLKVVAEGVEDEAGHDAPAADGLRSGPGLLHESTAPGCTARGVAAYVFLGSRRLRQAADSRDRGTAVRCAQERVNLMRQKGLTTARTTMAISSRLGASLNRRYQRSECRLLSVRKSRTRRWHQM